MRMNDGTYRHLRRNLDLPGHAHELTFCNFHGYKLLSKDRTRQWLINALKRARKIYELDIFAYVLMPEHAHILLRPTQDLYQMSLIKKSIKQPVATRAINFLVKEMNSAWLDRLTIERPGGKIERHFWQIGGGYDRNMVSPQALRAAIDYIHANPVRRGLVERSCDWEWSSACWWEGERDVPLAMDDLPSLDLWRQAC